MNAPELWNHELHNWHSVIFTIAVILLRPLRQASHYACRMWNTASEDRRELFQGVQVNRKKSKFAFLPEEHAA
jgi:hypothetical protein